MVNMIGGGTRALLRIENNNSVGSPGIIFGEGGGFTEDTQPTVKKVQGTNNLAIMCGGNVGIGTTTPLQSLHFVAQVSGNPTVVGTGTDSNCAVRFQMSSIALDIGVYPGGATWIQNRQPGTGLGTSYPLVLQPIGGSVGIGVIPSSYTLQVSGSIGATADITAFTSDERLKSKTGPITDALDKVCTLDTFTYTHNDLARSFGFTDKRQYVGISAQQVRKVQPEVVRIAPFDADGEGSKSGEDYITVQYERLVPLLIEALKEERKAREALEARVKLLEQK
jgi:hypothetical protein